jgi:predicted Zn finger-like uncharacterized protein
MDTNDIDPGETEGEIEQQGVGAMIVICEKCGKKYRIDPAKIKGRAASFKCRSCTHLIVVAKPVSQAAGPAEPQSSPESRATSKSITATVDGDAATAPSDGGPAMPAAAKTDIADPRRAGGIGLRTKMLVLFLLIPLFIMAGASLLFLWQLDTTADLLTRESSKFVNRMAEEKIASISAAVAKQCKLYLLSHPELQKEAFNQDIEFKSPAVQEVGLTGYTALYQLPGSDGVWRTWAHVQPEIIGIDMSTLRQPLKENFAGFWQIFTGVEGARKSQGYYTWQDKDGRFRNKFMVCTPIAETPFVIAATTYLDEFTGPLRLVESNAKTLTDRAKMITWTILGATLLLIGLIVFIYSHRLSGKIKSLTEVAERISVGELGMEIDTKSKDEIGELAEAIARMQDSIRR